MDKLYCWKIDGVVPEHRWVNQLEVLVLHKSTNLNKFGGIISSIQ
jgi:hypothetical protein